MIAPTMAKSINRAARKLALSDEDKQHLEEFEGLRDMMRDRVEQVARQFQTGCCIFGRPGTLKTVTTIETLKSLDVNFHLWNARMSPMGLWCVMRENPRGIIVADDLGTLQASSNKAGLQILLAGLGGEPGEGRRVSYATKEDRNSFLFYGGLIALGNSMPKRDPVADAFVSRTRLLEHEPSDEMIVAFMRAQALRGYKDLTAAESLEVVEYVVSEARDCDLRLELRQMVGGWEDFRFWKRGSRQNWKALIKSSMKKAVQPSLQAPIGRAERKEWEQELALRLLKRFPDDKDRRDQEWKAYTGKGPDSLYRRKRELEAQGRV